MSLSANLEAHKQPLVIGPVTNAEPGPDDVVVEMSHAGVNPLDRYTAMGLVAGDAPLPRVIGSEGSGHLDGKPVLVNGNGVGLTRAGTYASQAVVPRSAVVELPDGIDMAKAACLGVAGITAYNLVHRLGEVAAGDRVLVLGAGGGVGLPVISLLRSVGAQTWGQVGTESKAEAVRQAGAKEVVVADASNLADKVSSLQPTLVIDPLGGQFTGAALRALAPKGRVAIYGTSAGSEEVVPLQILYRGNSSVLGYSGFTLTDEERQQSARMAARALVDEEMLIPVDAMLPLDQINDAFTRLGNRSVTGKVVVEIGQG